MYAREFERIGKRLFAEHLVGGNFGNISVRKEDEGFLVTRTGDYLDVLPELVFVPLDGPVPDHASSEFRVHREIYRNTPYKTVVHAHPPAAIAASLIMDTIVPEDSEGLMFCPVIPVVPGARVPRRSQIMWPVHSRLQIWSSCGATVPFLPAGPLMKHSCIRRLQSIPAGCLP